MLTSLNKSLYYLFVLFILSFHSVVLANTTETTKSIPAAVKNTKAAPEISHAIVKVYTVSRNHMSSSPWYSDSYSASGSGVVISGNKILTNAHVIADSTFIEVKLSDYPKRYEAEVVMVSHEADLALLTVKDKSFFESTKALKIGKLPKIQEEITVYGFPTGGESLSVTKGVVSRIEYINFVHSDLPFLASQIDAAINPGNSGGPAISNEGNIVGIVMQKEGGYFSSVENIGYMISVPVIDHFLQDIADGNYDGFPEFMLRTQNLINPSLRRKYNLSDDQTGIVVSKTCIDSPPEKVLKVGDIITKIENHPIENDGSIELLPGKYVSYEYYIDQHQIGDKLVLDIIRNNKPQKVEIALDKAAYSLTEYDQKPRYYIYGGFVFSPYSADRGYLASSCYDEEEHKRRIRTDRKEYVSISKVLATDINKGYHDISLDVEKVNGKTFNTFDEFYSLMTENKNAFIVLEDLDGTEVVIERSLADAKHQHILDIYGIEADRSKDLQTRMTKAPTATAKETVKDQKLLTQQEKTD